MLEYVCPDGDGAAIASAREARFPAAKASVAGCAGLLRPEFLFEVFPTAVLA